MAGLRHPCCKLWLGIWSLLLGACSVLPDRGFPPFLDHDFTATCVVPADGRLPVPQSKPGLRIQDLSAEPPPAGEFYGADGARYWLWSPGTAVRIACRCRAYADPRGVVPTAAELLPPPDSHALQE